MKVYLVVGNTGGYSDHTQWNVALYSDRFSAEEHCRRLTEAVKGLQRDWKPEVRSLRDHIQETLDPNCSIDYTGTDYGVEELTLWAHLDQFLENFPTSKKGD